MAFWLLTMQQGIHSTECCYRDSKKVNPRVLLIFQPSMEIFGWNVIRLLNNKIYTSLPSFDKIYLKLTNLYIFDHDSTTFTAHMATCWAELACRQTVPRSLRISGSQTLQMSLLDYHMTSGCHVGEVPYLQLKPKMVDQLKVAMQAIWEELPEEHINEAETNIIKHLTAYVLPILGMLIADKCLGCNCIILLSNSRHIFTRRHKFCIIV